MKPSRSVTTTELKARCSEILRQVARRREPVVVTRRGRPIAEIVPSQERRETRFGFARGSIAIHGDIVAPLEVEWEAMEDE